MSPQAAAPTMKDQVAAFVSLSRQKKAIEADLRKVKDEMAQLDESLREHFVEHGLQRIGDADSGQTVYLRRSIRVKNMGDDRAEACAAMRAAGLSDYVAESFNLNSVSAYFREQIADRAEHGEVVGDPNDVLPEPLRGHIELVDDYQLRVTA